MSETKFRFVPSYVIDMARDAMAFLPGWALDDVRKQGAYSAHELDYVNEAGEHKTCRIGYDFGLTEKETHRAAFLAKHIEKMCGIKFVPPYEVGTDGNGGIVITDPYAVDEFNQMFADIKPDSANLPEVETGEVVDTESFSEPETEELPADDTLETAIRLMSYPRLDAFGISAAKVKKIVKSLTKSGMSEQDAFRSAVEQVTQE